MFKPAGFMCEVCKAVLYVLPKVSLYVLCGIGVSLILAVLFVYGHSHALQRGLQRAACHDFETVYRHYLACGQVSNLPSSSFNVIYYTNHIRVRGMEYECVLAMTWGGGESEKIIMAATKEGKAIWFGFDREKPPRFVEFRIPPTEVRKESTQEKVP